LLKSNKNHICRLNIDKHVEHLNHVLSLPTLSSLCLKLKKGRMKRFPLRSLAYWGILAAEAANKNIKIVQKMAFTYKDYMRCYRSPCTGIVLQCALQQGQPLFFLNIRHGGRASRGGRSPINELLLPHNSLQIKKHLCHLSTNDEQGIQQRTSGGYS